MFGKKRIGIAGHIRPDGDCVGSCTALYSYLMENKLEFQIEQVDVYLEPFGQEFLILSGADQIKHTYDLDISYDLFITLDCGSIDRLGEGIKYFDLAQQTLNIDHHISNNLFAMRNHVVDHGSSTCEVLFDLFEEEKISKEIAECLYVGIIHDTGVFKHSSTSVKTMHAAAVLMSRGIDFSKLIDWTFYGKTHMQNQLLGRCLMESILLMDGAVVISFLSKKTLDLYQATHADLDGIVDHLRMTKGTEVAIFVYETKAREYKVSLRSNGDVNVSKIAQLFSGGGHVKAAGCTMIGSIHDVINNLTRYIEAQLKL